MSRSEIHFARYMWDTYASRIQSLSRQIELDDMGQLTLHKLWACFKKITFLFTVFSDCAFCTSVEKPHYCLYIMTYTYRALLNMNPSPLLGTFLVNTKIFGLCANIFNNKFHVKNTFYFLQAMHKCFPNININISNILISRITDLCWPKTV